MFIHFDLKIINYFQNFYIYNKIPVNCKGFMYLANTLQDIIPDSVYNNPLDDYYRLTFSNSAKYLLSIS